MRKQYRRLKPIGFVLGNWKVVSYNESCSRNTYNCECLVCHNIIATNLTRMKSNSQCKCFHSITPKNHLGLPLLFLNSYIADANKRNIQFEITLDNVSDMLVKQNYKCALTGIDLVLPITAQDRKSNLSIDRIDSSKHYHPDNIQLVTKQINKLKSDFDQSVFIELCRLVVNQVTR